MSEMTLEHLSSSSSASTQLTTPENELYVDDHSYPALSFPGYAEKPLSEQLEPIAVIGMGKSAT